MFNPKYFRRFCTFLVLSLLQKFQSPYRASFSCGFTALFEFFGALTVFSELSTFQHSTVDNSPKNVNDPKNLKIQKTNITTAIMFRMEVKERKKVEACKVIESRHQQRWEEARIFETNAPEPGLRILRFLEISFLR